MALPAEGAEVTIGLRPQNISINPDGDDLTVYITEQLGGVSYVYLDAPTGDRLIVEARGGENLKPGSKAGVSFDPSTAMFFDAKTEARLR